MMLWPHQLRLGVVLALGLLCLGCPDKNVGQRWEDGKVGEDAARDAETVDATTPDATLRDAEVPDGGPTCAPVTYRQHRCNPGGCPFGMSLPGGCSFLPGADGVALLGDKDCYEAWADVACPTALDPVGGLAVDFAQERVIALTVTVDPWCEVQIVPTRVDDCSDRIVIEYDVVVTQQNCAAEWDTTELLVVPASSKPIEASLQHVTGCQPPELCEHTVRPGVVLFNTCLNP